MLERFTADARNALALSHREASASKHRSIGTDALLIGLLSEGKGLAARTFGDFGVSADTVRRVMASDVQNMETDVYASIAVDRGEGSFTPEARHLLEQAWSEAYRAKQCRVGTGWLLLGLIDQGHSPGCRILRELDVDVEQLRQQVVGILEERSDDPVDLAEVQQSISQEPFLRPEEEVKLLEAVTLSRASLAGSSSVADDLEQSAL